MYIPKYDEGNNIFCGLQLLVEKYKQRLLKPTNQASIKVPKVLSQRMREYDYKTFGIITIVSLNYKILRIIFFAIKSLFVLNLVNFVLTIHLFMYRLSIKKKHSKLFKKTSRGGGVERVNCPLYIVS